MNIWKRITSCVVCAGLLLLLAPVNGAARIAEMSLSVHAQESGTCGDYVTWMLDDEGILTIRGTGKMTDYNNGSSPFYDFEIIKVVIKPGVTSIGTSAFYRCTSLTDVTIPDSVTSIGSSVFDECKSLTSITVSAGNTKYTSINGVLYSKNPKTLVVYPGGKKGAFTIPDSVTSIGVGAFHGTPWLDAKQKENPFVIYYYLLQCP